MALEQEMKKTMENADFLDGLINEEDEDEDEDEALSLSDLPIVHDSQSPPRKESPKSMESLEEFNFCSSGRDSLFNDSELCTADEVFFQGQILPMRHSVSCDKSYNFQFRKSISNVDSKDHCSLSGFTSSRSSSISSRYSLSSSLNSTTTSSAASPTAVKNRVPKTRVLNQFQFSHPSPKPQIKPSSYNIKHPNPGNQNSRSAMWSIFRVGLVTTREIDIQELKFRSRSSSSSSSNRNSRSSNNTSSDGREKKKKNSIFNKNGGLFGNCKCSAVGTVDSRIGVMKRSQSVKEEEHNHVHVNNEKQQRGGIKQSLSRHRTFEWLKQLSLDAIVIDDM